MAKKQLLGIQQVFAATYEGLQPEQKEGYIWFVRPDANTYDEGDIYFGEKHYGHFGNQEWEKAIEEIEAMIGEGFDSAYTVSDAIEQLQNTLDQFASEVEDKFDEVDAELERIESAMTIDLRVAENTTEGYLKTYILSQGGVDLQTKIDIPKDFLVSAATLETVTSADTPYSGAQVGDKYIDFIINVKEGTPEENTHLYLPVNDLVDNYEAGDGLQLTDHTFSIKRDENSQEFLVVDENGISIKELYASTLELGKEIDAIDKTFAESAKTTDVLEDIYYKLGSLGAKKFVSPDKSVDIKTTDSQVDFKVLREAATNETVKAGHIELKLNENNQMYGVMYYIDGEEETTDVTGSTVPTEGQTQDMNLNITSSEAVNNMTGATTYKSLEVSNVTVASDTPTADVKMNANESIELTEVTVDGVRGVLPDGRPSNAKVGFNTPDMNATNVTVESGSTVYNVLEQVGPNMKPIDNMVIDGITVDDPALIHNVLNAYTLADNAVITVKNGFFNLNVKNSNVLRLANYTNATGVTVNFENVEWTYENETAAATTESDWEWAGLIIYQPASNDVALNGDYDKIATWKFNFKNCSYNGTVVTKNNYGQHNQVLYMYNLNKSGVTSDPAAIEGMQLNFN